MMSVPKSLKKKLMLGKARRKNRRLPVFVIAKTKRRITYNKFRRQWRTQKLKLKVKN